MGIIIRQSIKGTIVNYFGAFIGAFTTLFVITKFLQPEAFGLVTAITEAALLFAIFAQLGTSATAFRFFPYFKSEKNNNNGFFYYLVLLPTIGIFIFIPLYILLKDPISAYFSKNASLFVEYYYWVILLIIIIVFWTTFETYSNLLMRIVIPKFIREVVIRVLLLATYLLFSFKILNIDAFVGCIISVYGIALALTFMYVSRIGSISLKHDYSFIDNPLRKKIRNSTLFFVFSALSGSLLGQLDFFMVSSHLGLDYGGIYRFSFLIAAVIDIPSRSITAISSPIASNALKEGDLETANRLYKKVSLHQLIAGSAIFLLLWINIDNIFAVIPKGEVWATGKWVIFFLALCRILNLTVSFGWTLISFSNYYYWTLFFTIFITITAIITNLLLIPRMGITGAAVATLITTVLLCMVQQWIVLIKIKGNPFSAPMIKLLLLMLILFGINYALPHWSSNPFVDGTYRTFIIGTITMVSIYKLKISDEITNIMDKFLKRN